MGGTIEILGETHSKTSDPEKAGREDGAVIRSADPALQDRPIFWAKNQLDKNDATDTHHYSIKLEDPMKHITLCVMALLLTANAYCQPWGGPFGLKMGLTYSQLKAIDPGIEKVEKNEHMFWMTKVPTPHRDFKEYLMILSPSSGLAKVLAISNTIYSNGYGIQLKDDYQRIHSVLVEKYGSYDEYDFVKHESIWQEDKHFMMALSLEERVLNCYWNLGYRASANNNIAYVVLEALANDSTKGYIRMTYEFTNFSEYIEYNESQDMKSF